METLPAIDRMSPDKMRVRVTISVIRQEIMSIKATSIDHACAKVEKRLAKQASAQTDTLQSFVVCSAEEEY